MLALLLACTPDPKDSTGGCELLEAVPVDDPAEWTVEEEVVWHPVLSEPEFVIPGDGLPQETQTANNNVAIAIAGGRTFVAWRTAPNHFASSETELHIVSSETNGAPWTHEATFALGTDVREPAFLLNDGQLSISFFEAGANPGAFEPIAVWHADRCRAGDWPAQKISEGEKVPWDVKTRQGMALRTAYSGDHYGDGNLSLHFEKSEDGGASWVPYGTDPVSMGGDSEAAFEIAEDGSLWAVTRNEDGDATGYGSKLCTAPAGDWSAWDCPDVSDPERYDSPEMIRHGDDLYLLARRDVGGPFGPDGSLVQYSTRPKRSALYQIDRDARRVLWLQDIPGVGDTAFVSVWRTGAHSWLFANYTSPLDDPDISWLEGQTSSRGTQIYLATLSFEE
ncbi:MAG TPA: sialidase family protein [Myxococcota bacterium]|nr:sialidase family protein [Myxococcota bacterium]